MASKQKGAGGPPKFKNRITRTGTARPQDLIPNPQNWRVHPLHQNEAMRSMLDAVGWVQQVIVNETTGHLVDGHLRLGLAMENGEDEIPVGYVKLTEEEERAVLATLDPIAALAVAEVDQLEQLHQQAEQVLEGTTADAMLEDLIGQERRGLHELDTEGATHGKVANQQDFDPVLRFQVPSEVYAAWQKAAKQLDGETDAERFKSLVNFYLSVA